MELKASTYALAHRGCDAMAEIEAVGTQRLAGEKQMMGGGEDVGVAGKYTLARCGWCNQCGPWPALADNTCTRSAWPTRRSAINGMATMVQPRAHSAQADQRCNAVQRQAM